MNVKKLLLVVGVVLLGVALFFAGTSFAQSDGDDDEVWYGMMGGRGWGHGTMHGWDDDAEGGPYGDMMGDEAYHDAMHEAHGNMMGDEAYHDAMHEAHGDLTDGWPPNSGDLGE